MLWCNQTNLLPLPPPLYSLSDCLRFAFSEQQRQSRGLASGSQDHRASPFTQTRIYICSLFRSFLCTPPPSHLFTSALGGHVVINHQSYLLVLESEWCSHRDAHTFYDGNAITTFWFVNTSETSTPYSLYKLSTRILQRSSVIWWHGPR